MNSYKSDFPNQVQQLNVSISQHYHVLKDGTIKWQDKKFDINWSNYIKSGKNHLVTFMIRDHFSSCFYAELHRIEAFPKIEEFLFAAWSKKDDYEFQGIGRTVIIPKITIEQFPELGNFFKRTERSSLEMPTSGFSSAVRSILEWEKQLKLATSIIKGVEKLPGFQDNIDYINRFVNNGYGNRKDTNLKKWLNNKPQILLPGSKDSFFKYFNPVNNASE